MAYYRILSDIPQFEQNNNEIYNNLTIHTIWVFCIYSMSLFHLFKPWLALVWRKKHRSTDNVMTFFFIYIVQYVTYVLVAEYLLCDDCIWPLLSLLLNILDQAMYYTSRFKKSIHWILLLIYVTYVVVEVIQETLCYYSYNLNLG